MNCSLSPVQFSNYNNTDRLLKGIRLDPCSQEASCLVTGMKGKPPESYRAPCTIQGILSSQSSVWPLETRGLLSDMAEESNWPISWEFNWSSASYQILSVYCPPRLPQKLAEYGNCYDRGANKGIWEHIVLFPVASFPSQGLCQPCHLGTGWAQSGNQAPQGNLPTSHSCDSPNLSFTFLSGMSIHLLQ